MATKYRLVSSKNVNIFNYNDCPIRQLWLDDDVWFVGRDVATVLGYKKPRNAISVHVAEDDKQGAQIKDANGRRQSMIVINESGLYALIFGSKLEVAKQFKRWVTNEVLPSIRKTGNYTTPAKKVPDLEDFDFGGFSVPTTRTEALALAVELSGKIEKLETELKEMQPIKEWADSATIVDQDIPMDIAAKLLNQAGYDIGARRLLDILRRHNILCTERNNWNRPRQAYIDNGMFKVRWTYGSDKNGNSYVPYVSTKGIEWLFKKFASGEFTQSDSSSEKQLPLAEPILLN